MGECWRGSSAWKEMLCSWVIPGRGSHILGRLGPSDPSLIWIVSFIVIVGCIEFHYIYHYWKMRFWSYRPVLVRSFSYFLLTHTSVTHCESCKLWQHLFVRSSRTLRANTDMITSLIWNVNIFLFLSSSSTCSHTHTHTHTHTHMQWKCAL